MSVEADTDSNLCPICYEVVIPPHWSWTCLCSKYCLLCVAKTLGGINLLKAEHPPCPKCRCPWNHASSLRFENTCAEANIPQEVFLNTTLAAQAVQNEEPESEQIVILDTNRPDHAFPLCCNRKIAISERGQPTLFVTLPERDMEWLSPDGPFVCLTCQAEISCDDPRLLFPNRPLPGICVHHGFNILVFDAHTGGRFFGCARNSGGRRELIPPVEACKWRRIDFQMPVAPVLERHGQSCGSREHHWCEN